MTSLLEYRCWACHKTVVTSHPKDIKWHEKHGWKPDARPLCADCSTGGYFGGS